MKLFVSLAMEVGSMDGDKLGEIRDLVNSLVERALREDTIPLSVTDGFVEIVSPGAGVIALVGK